MKKKSMLLNTKLTIQSIEKENKYHTIHIHSWEQINFHLYMPLGHRMKEKTLWNKCEHILEKT